MRYEAAASAPFLTPARSLLDGASVRRAETLGVALRLAYTLSAGTPDLLAATSLGIGGGRLTLRLDEDRGVFAGESVARRLGSAVRGRGQLPAPYDDIPVDIWAQSREAWRARRAAV